MNQRSPVSQKDYQVCKVVAYVLLVTKLIKVINLFVNIFIKHTERLLKLSF